MASEAIKKPGEIPTWLASGIICLALGAAGGYYAAQWNAKPVGGGPPGGGGMGGMRGGGGPGGGGGMGGMTGGGGPGGGAQNTQAVVRYVRNLAVLERYKAAPLTAEQKKRLEPVLASLSPGVTLKDDEAGKLVGQIEGVLTGEQKQLFEDMRPARGGRGGGMGGMMGGSGMMGGGRPDGPGGMMGGSGMMGGGRPGGPGGSNPSQSRPGGGMMGAGGMGGAGGAPDKPFSEGADKDRLDELKHVLAKP